MDINIDFKLARPIEFKLTRARLVQYLDCEKLQKTKLCNNLIHRVTCGEMTVLTIYVLPRGPS